MRLKGKTKLAGMCLILLANAALCQTGTWTPLTNPAPGWVWLMLLLPDGTVMAATYNGSPGNAWYRLSPDTQGHYVNGVWSALAPMTDTRIYYSSDVLRDGRVFVAGGENGTGGAKAEVYDPQTNVWTPIVIPPNLITGSGFVDSESKILSNGNVLVAPVYPYIFGGTVIFNPVTNTLSAGPTLYRGGNQAEANWVKLPDESILTIDPGSTTSERYIPSLNSWVDDGVVPVDIHDPFISELGGPLLLPNGKAFFIGGSGHTALYTPSGTSSPGAWATGPDLPNGQGMADAAAAMMVNGKALCAVSAVPTASDNFTSPTSFYEYDYSVGAAGSFTRTGSPTGGLTDNVQAYFGMMLDLPDGNVLFAQIDSQLYVYQPVGSPLASWKPTISAVTPNGDGSYHLTGTQLNGISEGSSYGDDAQMDSNYPLVRFTDGSGKVSYGRTYNWSSTGVTTGSAVVSTEFRLPASLAGGSYLLEVVANGIGSDATTFVNPAPTPTPTKTVSPSPTRTATGTPSPTRTATGTVSPSRTRTATGTPSPTRTATGTITPSRTFTPSPTRSATTTPSPTRSPTTTPTRSPTGTPTGTASPLPTVPPPGFAGGPLDVPVQEAGDWWQYDRTFILGIPTSQRLSWINVMTLQINERFTKTVDTTTPIPAGVYNSLGGPFKVYLRNRSNTTATGTGLIATNVPGYNVRAALNLTSLSTTAGLDWRQVSDMAEVRESFNLSGTIRSNMTADDGCINVNPVPNPFNNRFLLNYTMEYNRPLEYADFPLDTANQPPGENWQSRPLRRVFGTIHLEMPTLGLATITSIPATTIDLPFDSSQGFTFTHVFTNTVSTGRGPWDNSRRIVNAASAKNAYYNATAHEFIDLAQADVTANNSAGSLAATFNGWDTLVTGSVIGNDYSVAANADVGDLAINPAWPHWGQLFTISGSSDLGTQMTAEITDTGTSATDAISGGLFNLVLRAPSANDSSPMGPINTDWGSYGIELTRNTVGPTGQRKYATVRLGTPLVALSATSQTVTEGMDPNAAIAIRLIDMQGNPVTASWNMDVTVNYATSNGTAVRPGDYTSVSGTATIGAYQGSTNVLVPIIDDGLTEPTEFFLFTISSPNANAILGNVSPVNAPVVETVFIFDHGTGPTRTATLSPTRSATPTPTRTITISPTRTSTPSPTRTGTPTKTRTATVTGSGTITPSPTRTATDSPTATPTPTCPPNSLLATLNNPAPAPSDNFGISVAISGNLAIVGSWDADPGGVTDAGSAYVFDATAGGLVSTLNESAPATSDWFGYSVAISGNLAVVGAIGDDPGAVSCAGTAYVFNAATGASVTTLNNPAPAANDSFGASVAISGNLAVVGTPYDDPGGVTDAGTAYVFNATSGALVATLNKPTPTVGDEFGWAVGISGNLAVVGARWDDPGGVSNAGAAYVFNAATGALVATLSNPTPTADDLFGASVAISGNLAVVGAPQDDPGGVSGAGTAYVFDATTGAMIATLSNPAPAMSDFFGRSVAISGNNALVGADGDDPGGMTNAGTAYVFDATTGALAATLNNPAPTAGDQFGWTVGISGTVAVIGALYDDPGGVTDAGSAYAFTCASLVPTVTPTRTTTPTQTRTASLTPTRTFTLSPTRSATRTTTRTSTPSPTPTATPSLTPSPTPCIPGAFTDRANADLPVAGTVTGDYTGTLSSDNGYESIAEVYTGGYWQLTHKWTLPITAGSNVHTFSVEAFHTTNPSGQDDFIFSYSTDDVAYTAMLTVTKTADDNTPQTFALPASLPSTLYIRVVDSLASDTNSNANRKTTISVDDMFVASTIVCPTPTPTGTLTPSPSRTSTPTATRTASLTPTASRTATSSATRTASLTPTPTRTGSGTATRSATPTGTRTATLTATPTRTATLSASRTATFSPTRTATLSPTPTASATTTRSSTRTPTRTATLTNTRTGTVTLTPTRSATLSPTRTGTLTATRSSTPTPTRTASATGTRTATPTNTRTSSLTATSTRTATSSPTRTGSATASRSSTRTATRTGTVTSTRTASLTPTRSSTATPTRTASLTATRSSTPTSTRTATVSGSGTITPSPTRSSTRTPTRTATLSPTRTGTLSPTRSATFSPTRTSSLTPTPSRTATFSPTRTGSVTASRSATRTPTRTGTLTSTRTATTTSTRSATLSPTRTGTLTATRSASLTPTPTRTATLSPTRTATVSGSGTITPSPTRSATVTPSGTLTPSPTRTGSATATRTATLSPTRTSTKSATSTASASPTRSSTRTSTRTASKSPTRTATLSRTRTATKSPTRSSTRTPTRTATLSPTRTATLTPTPCVPGTFTDRANADLPVTGTVTGNYTNTLSSDNGYETIAEVYTGGYWQLKHKWTIPITPGSDVHTFSVEAFHGTNTNGQDDFIFSYSTDNVTFSNMLTVTKTADNNGVQTFALPASLPSVIYIRVADSLTFDTNPSPDRATTINVDDMFITSTITCGTTPTPTPTRTATATATRTATRTNTRTATQSATPTRTASKSATFTASTTSTPTRSASSTATRTGTRTPSPTPSATQTPIPSPTPTATPSPTQSATPTPNSARNWEIYE